MNDEEYKREARAHVDALRSHVVVQVPVPGVPFRFDGGRIPALWATLPSSS
jgi:hypothetical protein